MKREQASRDRFITGGIALGLSFDVSPSTPVHLHAVPEAAATAGAAKKESGVISTPTPPTPHRIASHRIESYRHPLLSGCLLRLSPRFPFVRPLPRSSIFCLLFG